jgi:hypothetical protein
MQTHSQATSLAQSGYRIVLPTGIAGRRGASSGKERICGRTPCLRRGAPALTFRIRFRGEGLAREGRRGDALAGSQ